MKSKIPLIYFLLKYSIIDNINNSQINDFMIKYIYLTPYQNLSNKNLYENSINLLKSYNSDFNFDIESLENNFKPLKEKIDKEVENKKIKKKFIINNEEENKKENDDDEDFNVLNYNHHYNNNNNSSSDDDDDDNDEYNYYNTNSNSNRNKRYFDYFVGFIPNFLPNEIVKEKIYNIAQGQNLVLLRLEYYTTIADLNGNEINKNLKKINKNDEDNENKRIKFVDINKRFEFKNERTFIKKMSREVNSQEYVVIKNKKFYNKFNNDEKKINEKCCLTFIRYVLLSLGKSGGKFGVKIKSVIRKQIFNKSCNYFINENYIDNVNPENYTNMININKLFIDGEFLKIDNIGINIDVKFKESNEKNYYQ